LTVVVSKSRYVFELMAVCLMIDCWVGRGWGCRF